MNNNQNNNAELNAIVGSSPRWTNPCRHVFGTIWGTPEHFDRFVNLCEELHEAGDLTRVIIGEELAPTTGRPHMHITCSHNGKKSWSWWKTKLNDAGLYIGRNSDDVEPSENQPENVFAAWLRVQRGSHAQAKTYCLKNGNMRLNLDREPPSRQGERTDISAFVEAVKNGRITNTREALNDYPDMVALYPRFIELCFKIHTELDWTRGAPMPTNLYSWQVDMIDIALRDASVDPENRKINVVLGTVGNEGKSWMSRWLQRIVREYFGRHDYKVQVIRPNKADNMAYVLKDDNDCVIFDVPRARIDYFQYHLCEEIKDGFITSYKYEPREMVLKPAHLFLMCNEFNNEDGKGGRIFSDDRLRWIVIGENDMRARHFEEARARLARQDPVVPNHGPEFNGDNAGDGPVMNNACYKFMTDKQGPKLIDGIPVVDNGKVWRVPPGWAHSYHAGTSYKYETKGWPSAYSDKLVKKDKQERWCMREGVWISFDHSKGDTTPVYYYTGPYEGKSGQWSYMIPEPNAEEPTMESVGTRMNVGKWLYKLPPGTRPYIQKVTIVNELDYSFAFGWRRGAAPPPRDMGDEPLVPESERPKVVHPKDHEGGYDGYMRDLKEKHKQTIESAIDATNKKDKEKEEIKDLTWEYVKFLSIDKNYPRLMPGNYA